MNEQTEVWRPVAGLVNQYEISSAGRVKSLARTYESRPGVPYSRKESILRPGISNGYCSVVIGSKSTQVHRLVALAFIPNPENKALVNHKNGIKTDNRVENLEWVSASENMLHKIRQLNKRVSGGFFITENDALDIRSLIAFGARVVDIADAFDISTSQVYSIKHRRSWAHI